MDARWGEARRWACLAAALFVAFASPAHAVAATTAAISPALLAAVFPGADAAGATTGMPPAAPVFRQDQLVGYVFFSKQAVASTGFSGRPIDVLVGLGLDGVVQGAKLIEHHEPILAIGVETRQLEAFIAQYKGRDVRNPVRIGGRGRTGGIDSISGATVSSIVLNDAIMRSARAVARARGILEATGRGGVDLDRYEKVGWKGLLEDGSIARLHVTNAELAKAAPDAELAGPPANLFIDLYTALMTPARIGRNLLGDRDYAQMMAKLGPGEQVILIAANGLYSFKGTAFTRTGRFERVEIHQDDRTIPLLASFHQRRDRLTITDAPDLRELGLFTIPKSTALDPTRPWQLDLLVSRTARDGSETFARFSLPYRIPSLYLVPAAGNAGPLPAEAESASETNGASTVPTFLDLLAPDPPSGERPLWQQIWRGHPVKIAVLLLSLAALGIILVFQDWFVRRQHVYKPLRLGFLLFTLLWLGWYAGAQLSVVNVLTFIRALLSQFRWEFFLVDPLMFILWSAVAVALLFWGRGVYCGWLCPFGALQELLNAAARTLRVPQWRVPFLVNERLWPIKYVLFIGLFALSLQSLEATLPWAEVEPFKTAIVLKFQRAWPFLLYVGLLLVAGLFVERFFCRYLCPLGAALAIPARLRMFEWLKRKRQCGAECQVCAVHCPVQAIHPEGRINPNECIQCLNCQILYYDDHMCPPLIERRKRRMARSVARTAVQAAQASGTEGPAP